MKKVFTALLVPLCLICLPGCSQVTDSVSVSSVYGGIALFSLILLFGYFFVAKKKSFWFIVLFSSVLVVNTGYFMLSVSDTLDAALFANRISYLGSVFLPLSMCIIVLDATRIRFPRWLPWLLTCLAAIVFLIAASGGYLTIYYKEVTLEKIDGATVLHKVYGPLHNLYPIYLLGYFSTMVVAIIHTASKQKPASVSYTVILAIAIVINLVVWAVEQFMDNAFELLSVSYIISELFLLGLHLIMAEQEKILQKALTEAEKKQSVEPRSIANIPSEQIALFLSGLQSLTPKEKKLFDCYVAGMTTAEIMEQLQIKENTLKFHNKNLYSKLGVSSRKQLLLLYRNTIK